MSCTGCFNGCTQITSDKCVKYTGNDIEFLGVENGMSLAEVEEKITDYLQTVLDGSGIIPTLPESICTLIDDLLPSSGDITLNHVISALIAAACSLQTQVTSVSDDVAVIEADYTIGTCLTGVVASSGTHNILQAVINQLCTVSAYVTALQNALVTYVAIADIDTYIANYLATNVASTKMYTKMVPYAAIEFYGDLTGKFDLTGAGIGDWEYVYLCNGLHGTPDKRGVFPVGVTGMGNAPYGGAIIYGLSDTGGSNNVTLATANVPAHNHNVVVTLSDPGHKHLFGSEDYIDNGGYQIAYSIIPGNKGFQTTADPHLRHFYTKNVDNTNNPQTTGITVSGVTVSNTGSNVAHENRPPYLACYYIMYVP